MPGCSCCGAPLDPVDLDIRSLLPDPIAALPDEERAGAWGDRNLQLLDGVGAFVRCLMPVRLTGGDRVMYSVWLSVRPEVLQHAHDVWDTPAYADLLFDGAVANVIQPWPGLYGVAAAAKVRHAGQLPFLFARDGGLLGAVLSQEWDRDDVLSRVAHALPVHVRQRVTEDWSIVRTAGLEPRPGGEVLRFVGPGRTAQLDAFTVPPGIGVEDAVARMLDGAPTQRTGALVERDGGLLRQALWLEAVVDGRRQFELYGVVAAPGALLNVTCMYDEPADLAWAQGVWRSARRLG